MPLAKKKLKIVEVSNDVIAEILKFAIQNRVPDDTRVHSMFLNPQKNCINVVVESNEYEEVDEGAVIPTIKNSPVLSRDMFIMQVANMKPIKNARKDLKILL